MWSFLERYLNSQKYTRYKDKTNKHTISLETKDKSERSGVLFILTSTIKQVYKLWGKPFYVLGDYPFLT